MKMFALVSIMLVGSAFADVPTITASKTSCKTLKAKLETYGSLVVVKKILLIKKRYVVHHSVECGSDEVKEYGDFKTRDNKHCIVGESCKSVASYSSGSYSGGSYDSGYSSGSSYDSGSYSSGSSWDSGSSSGSGSSSSGSNYNPPSSSDHGSSYNPPSSSDRGSRYCPTCSL